MRRYGRAFFILYGFLLLSFVAMVCYVDGAEWELKNYDTYYGTTDEAVTIQWDSAAHYYSVYVWFTGYDTRDDSVTYEIYDNDTVIDTIVVDQSDTTIASTWHLLGKDYVLASTILRVILTSDTGGSCSADAVKITEGICDNSAVILDNDGTGTSSTGVWEVSSALNPYGTDSLYNSDGSTYTWAFTDLKPTIPTMTYDYYIESVERGFNYLSGNTSNSFVSLLLPKSGHYFFHVRASLPLNTTELEFIAVMDRTQLETYIADNLCDVTVTTDMTDDDVRAAIIASGKKSSWAVSDNIDYVADCEGLGAFWIYGTLAPPGPIVIE